MIEGKSFDQTCSEASKMLIFSLTYVFYRPLKSTFLKKEVNRKFLDFRIFRDFLDFHMQQFC